MSKITFLLLYLVAIIAFCFPSLVFADNDTVFVTSIYPNPPTINDKQAWITVESFDKNGNPKNFFQNTKQDYAYIIRYKDVRDTNSQCGSYLFGVVQPENDHKIFATFPINNCTKKLIGGPWHFQLWQGNSYRNLGEASEIVHDFIFFLEQGGGQEPGLNPVKPAYGLEETPEVNLSNARRGNTYTFWWDGVLNREIAAKFTPKNDGIFKIPLKKNGVNFQQLNPPTKKLCMEIGDLLVPIAQKCRYATTFTFQINPIEPGQPECSIIPEKPKITDNPVSIQVINVKPESLYMVRFTQKSGITITDTQPADDSGVVLLRLGSNLPKEQYTADVFDVTNQNKPICSKTFSVGDQKQGQAPPQECKPGDENCSSAAGTTCNPKDGTKDEKPDPNHKGVFTAIGCIPTEPIALIEGLMKVSTGAGGGIALLLMIAGVFKIITSSGNPDGIKAGKEQITNAVIGLLFIIFSVLLLQIIGVNILSIPGFS